MWERFITWDALEQMITWLPLFALKSLLVVSLGFLALVLLRGASASTRYFCWLLVFVALPLVPFGPPPGSGWQLAVPGLPLPARVESAQLAGRAGPEKLPQTGDKVQGVLGSEAPLRGDNAQWAGAAKLGSDGPVIGRLPFASLSLFWMVGVALTLSWFAVGHFLLWRAARESDAHGLEHWGKCAATLAKGRAAPRILICKSVKAPLLWGFFRPNLLLPPGARAWSEAHIRMTLTHELYHLYRHDHRINLLTQLAVALHWFNPLVHMARKRLAFEQERSCDNAVLRSGVVPHAYAELLLELAWKPRNALAAPSAAVSIGFDVKARLHQILASENSRERAGRFALFSLFLAAFALLVPMALLRPVAAASMPPAAADASTPNQRESSWDVQHEWSGDEEQNAESDWDGEQDSENGTPLAGEASDLPDTPDRDPQNVSAAAPAGDREREAYGMPEPEPAAMIGEALQVQPGRLSENEMDLLYDRFEMRLEQFEEDLDEDIETFEEQMERVEETVEDRLDRRGADRLEERFEEDLEVLEDALDSLEDRVAEALENLEERFLEPLDGESPWSAAALADIEKNLEAELSGLHLDYRQDLDAFLLKLDRIQIKYP